MQKQISDEYPSLAVAFVGVNLLGLEEGNAGASAGKSIPWLQDEDKDGDGVSDVWKDWGVGHLDMVILDGDNRKIGALNAASADLSNPYNYGQLLEGLISVATVEPPTGLDLLPVSDSGRSQTDNRTNFNNASSGTALQVKVDGVTAGATVGLYANGAQIGEAIASGTSVIVTSSGTNALADGTHNLTAAQRVRGLTSSFSSALTIRVDTSIAPFSSTPPSQATVNAVYSYDVQNPDEGEEGFTYSLLGAPSGAAIHAASSLLTWTPTAAQVGRYSFSVVATDVAGNTRTQPVTIDVAAVTDDKPNDPPVNAPPTVVDDSFSFPPDSGTQVLDVLGNDSAGPGSGSLTIVAVGTPSQNGSASISSDTRSIRYTPAAGFQGTETFSYTVDNGSGVTRQGLVTVTLRDFAPSSVSGFVYQDANGNGLVDATERRLGHVTITLDGTDFAGKSVQRSETTAADGSYRFTDLPPGRYRVIQTQPEFLLDGSDTVGSQGGDNSVKNEFSIELEQGVDAVGYNFGERGLPADLITMRFFMSSTPQRATLAAAVPEGDCQWYSAEDWQAQPAAAVRMSPDGSTATVAVTQWNGERRAAEIRTAPGSPSRVLGISGEIRLLQLADATARLEQPLQQSSLRNGANDQGEGEAAVTLARLSGDERPLTMDWAPQDATNLRATIDPAVPANDRQPYRDFLAAAWVPEVQEAASFPRADSRTADFPWQLAGTLDDVDGVLGGAALDRVDWEVDEPLLDSLADADVFRSAADAALAELLDPGLY